MQIVGAVLLFLLSFAGLGFFHEMYVDNFVKPISINLEDKNFFISVIQSSNKRIDGQSCIGIYAVLIGNNKLRTTTLKQMSMKVSIRGSWVEGTELKPLLTTEGADSAENKWLVLSNGIDKLNIAWNYLTNHLDTKSISYGTTQVGQLVFSFPVNRVDMRNAEKIQVEATDFFGKIVRTERVIQKNDFMLIDKCFVVLHDPKEEYRALEGCTPEPFLPSKQ